ncbi:hypothetical protein BpHYR1_048734 [Brachionus plicatilis]|uniref:Uncharacterized protein n=1 Tax=Brachionus plicatilis TaxID=10195 RepID=A0A3M7Q8I7_BRAPC|nr:hypothetical protein BpHYR1_048734 [Brachionus plicatilis]
MVENDLARGPDNITNLMLKNLSDSFLIELKVSSGPIMYRPISVTSCLGDVRLKMSSDESSYIIFSDNASKNN